MISVALAAYNGSAYLAAQVDSILSQLHVDDQMVISVDPSTDATLELARSFAAKNPCITVLEGPGQGLIKNFERAIAACEGTRIFLSDQDDIWCSHKVASVLNAFATSNADLILHDAEIVDEALNTVAPSFFAQRGSKPGYHKNIAKNSYVGCCMAFKRSLKHMILPFPEQIPMHDQWIGLLAEKYGEVFFLREPLVKYRRHETNSTASTHADPVQMLTWRKDLIKALNQREKEIDGELSVH
jgi:glycosyltransferase involved in cell wall biosynthesis